MENNQRNSRKRLNSLILLVAFTAVMLIVSTYAWFSTQKNVTLTGIKGTVEVAEGLQISLDAKTWKNEIDFSTFTNAGASTSDTYFPGGTLAAPATGISNVIPGELLPASTTGTEDINTGTTITMYRGVNEEGSKLESISAVSESGEGEVGYYAIDLFLQNSTAGDADDTLQLEANSSISISGDAATGLQNTLRVALALMDTGVEVDGKNGQTEILNTLSTAKIYDVAIWEPNADMHSTYVQNNQKISYDGSALTAIAAETEYPTWAVNKNNTGTIDDVYYWNTANTGLSVQNTLETSGLSSLSTTEMVSATDGSTTAVLPANNYVRARMYIWLEGQDVDCINQASYGGDVTVNFGFSKPGSQS